MIKNPLPDATMDLDVLKEAIELANLPALLMVLFQLTGDGRWLEDPYRPSRRFGMDPNDSGGFPLHIVEEIRTEAHLAISKWATGTPPAVPKPSGQLMKNMMSLVVSEDVPPEYEPMMAVQMGFASQRAVSAVEVRPGLQVVVIGAGLGGLMSAIRLEEAGIPYVVLERFHHAGGVWWANRYPGAGVDTPSYLYSFSFFPRNWSTFFAKRDELVEYVDAIMSNRFWLLPNGEKFLKGVERELAEMRG